MEQMTTVSAGNLLNQLRQIESEFGSLDNISLSVWVSEEHGTMSEELTGINFLDVITEGEKSELLHSINLNVY